MALKTTHQFTRIRAFGTPGSTLLKGQWIYRRDGRHAIHLLCALLNARREAESIPMNAMKCWTTCLMLTLLVGCQSGGHPDNRPNGVQVAEGLFKDPKPVAHSDQEAEAFALLNEADRVIKCSNQQIVRDPDSQLGYREELPDEPTLYYDLGIREVDIWAINNPTPFVDFVKPHRPRIIFEFVQIQGFLKQERHKDLLVLRIDKRILMDKQGDAYIALAKEQTRDIGYERVVILGASGLGTWKLYDSAK